MSRQNKRSEIDRADSSSVQIQAVEQRFSGPLPHPSLLEHYDKVLPGSAERIILMAERQQAHRQAIESAAIAGNLSDQRRGPILGFLIALTAICGGIYLAAIGKETTGVVAIISALAALVGVFVYGKQAQQRELARKNKDVH